MRCGSRRLVALGGVFAQARHVPGKSGLLLVNLGTPDAPAAPEVRRYLAEFLSDPRVIDIHPVARWLLLHLIILRVRPAKSAEAYRKVWSSTGSPLLHYGRELERGVRAALADDDVPVALAMRYGKPSIDAGIEQLLAAGCERLIVFPLYPQYASSSTGSTLEALYRNVAARWNAPYVSIVPPFYDDPRFIGAFAAVGKEHLREFAPDHVLFSFHGLPERHIRKGEDAPGHCLRESCCDQVGVQNRNCYRAQCFATARGITQAVGVEPGRTSVAFQSRLGRTPWIRPYTDERIVELAKSGTRRLAVFCPAFVADCLETLEEIGMRADEEFRAHGGEALRLIPSLNDHPEWIATVASMARELHAGGPLS